ncbi:MAG: restriction endonuclease subunit S [Deltaproteobacteria bacterium]|nr:restriction endonuclease subunit S [Deltaproteobacteria bacterium]
MAGEWRASTWGEEISLEYGKALRGHDETQGRYRVFGSNGPIGWTSEPIAPGPGVILGRKGAYRGVRYSPRPFFVIDTAYYVVPRSELDMRWLYYAIKHYKLGEVDDGSPIPSTTRAAVYMLDLDVPPLPEQRAIAHILGTLDDRIELNRRMNETLEAMARALFKSWFVDFDPVRAKVAGRDPGLPKRLADLFPDSFEDSELGEIPEGWRVGVLGDVLQQRVERCVSSTETASRPYVPIDCISPRSLSLTESKPGAEAQSSLTRFHKGDLLFGAMRPYFHKVCIAPFDGTTRTTAFVLAPRRRGDFGFGTLLLHHPDTIDYATRHSTGSTIPYAVWTSSLEHMPVVIPPPAVRDAFDGKARPLLDRIAAPYFETNTLAALRDTLLPKLISGELRISDTRRILAGVDA